MNNINHNGFNSTVGFNDFKIGRLFELESFANDFNNRLKKAYENLQDIVINIINNILYIFRKKRKQKNLLI